MKRLSLLLLCMVIFANCDLLNSSKKKEKAEMEQKQQDDNAKAEKKRAEEGVWIDANKATAQKKATDFAQKEGFSIQSISTTNINVNKNIGAKSPVYAYFDYTITTGDTSRDGRLIYIIVRVKYENGNWIVDVFRPGVI